MTTYYNEIDPYAAQWLRNLIAAGHIAPGEVDERSIEDVFPDDLRPYTQCHFFAGIGVWSYALRRAGWPDDRPVWTGSCPCQPFSTAGKGVGFDDERHLWPAWHWLIGECRPPIVLGEQVASKAANPWLDLVATDLEALDFAFGAIAFPAASVGAPHIRDRTYWLAHADGARLERGSRTSRLDDPEHGGRKVGQSARQGATSAVPSSAEIFGAGPKAGYPKAIEQYCGTSWLGNADGIGRKRRQTSTPGHVDDRSASQRTQIEHGIGIADQHRIHQHNASPTNGLWADADWLLCRDGKWRPVERGTSPLAHGIARPMGRVRADQNCITQNAPRKDQGSRPGRLRGYGNAINAVQAQIFIQESMRCIPWPT